MYVFENVKSGWRLGRETRKLIMLNKQLFVYPPTFLVVPVIIDEKQGPIGAIKIYDYMIQRADLPAG